MADRPLFDERDTQIARRYVEEKYQIGAFDPVAEEGIKQQDLVAIASIASTREYFRQSQGSVSEAGRQFRAYPTMINTSTPNAFATTRSGLHICGLHVGLYAMVHEICLFTMAQSRCFKDVGDPSREHSPRYGSDDFAAFWILDHTDRAGPHNNNQLLKEIVPKCPDRYLFAIHLTLLMLRFVWLHEQVHCLNGHVDYLATFNKDIRLNEVADPSLSFVELDTAPLPLPWPRLLPALELDADRTAMYWAYRIQLENNEVIVGIAQRPSKMRRKMALFTALLITFLFDQINIRQGFKGDTHPDSHTRLHDIIRTVAGQLLDMDSNIRELFPDIMAEFTNLADCLPGLPTGAQLLDSCADTALQTALDLRGADLQTARLAFAEFGYR